MKLYGAWTPSWQRFHDIFIGSLKDNFDLHLTYLPWVRGDGSWQSEGMKIANYVMWRAIANATISNEGEVIAVADMDIEWYSSCERLFAETVAGYDCAFARESKYEGDIRLNMGVCVLTCNARTQSLMKWYADYLFDKYLVKQETVLGQEEFLRYLVKTPHIKWTYLPRSIASFAVGGQDLDFPEMPVLYHANGLPTLDHKVEYFGIVKRHLALT